MGTPSAKINSNGQMVFNKACVHKFGLTDCFIEIDRWDAEKRALGWRKVPRLSEGDWTKSTRMLQSDKKTGVVKISIGKIMTVCGIEKLNYPTSEVESYQDLMEKQEIYYVIIPSTSKKKTDESL